MFLLFIILFALRIINIEADAPVKLSSSRAPFTDEGFYAHNARNQILFGNWILDEWNPIYSLPLFTVVDYIGFSLFGVGLVQIRFMSVLFSILTLLFLYFLVMQSWDRKVATLSLLFLGLNYISLMYNRLALAENSMIFFVVFSIFLYQRGTIKNVYYFLSGVACFCAYLIKPFAILFFAIYSVYFLIDFIKTKKELSAKNSNSGLLEFLFGMGFIAGLWLILWVLPNFNAFCTSQVLFMHSSPKFPQNIFQVLNGLITIFDCSFFFHLPIISLLAYSYLLFLMQHLNILKPLEVFMLIWLVLGVTFVTILNYRPLRYYLFLLPPMSVFASLALIKLYSGCLYLIEKRSRIKNMVNWLWLVFLNYGFMYTIFYSLFNELNGIGRSVVLSISVALSFNQILIFKYLIKRSVFARVCLSKTGKICAVLAVIFFIGIDAQKYLHWVLHPHYTMVETSSNLGEILKPTTIAGPWAVALSLENKHKVLRIIPGFINDNISDFKRYGVTNFVLEQCEYQELIANNPELTKNIKNNRIHKVGKYELSLYSFDNNY